MEAVLGLVLLLFCSAEVEDSPLVEQALLSLATHSVWSSSCLLGWSRQLLIIKRDIIAKRLHYNSVNSS